MIDKLVRVIHVQMCTATAKYLFLLWFPLLHQCLDFAFQNEKKIYMFPKACLTHTDSHRMLRSTRSLFHRYGVFKSHFYYNI